MQCLVGQDKDLIKYPLPDREPMELHQARVDMFMLLSVGNEMGCSILDTLKFM